MKPATLGERVGLKARGPTKQEEKPRFQYDPISEEIVSQSGRKLIGYKGR